jgi:IS5 family transposase
MKKAKPTGLSDIMTAENTMDFETAAVYPKNLAPYLCHAWVKATLIKYLYCDTSEDMNKQQTFTDMEYAQRKRTGRRKKFPDAIISRAVFEETTRPFYPKSGLRGRQPKGIELMLRMYFPRVRFNLADESLEENTYDSYAMWKFMRLDYFKEDVPDAAALLKFRHPH